MAPPPPKKKGQLDWTYFAKPSKNDPTKRDTWHDFPEKHGMPVKTKLLKLWFPTLQGEGWSLSFFGGNSCRRAKGKQCNYCKAESFWCFWRDTFLGGEISGNSHLTFQILKPKHEILKNIVEFHSSKKTSTSSKLNTFTMNIAGKSRHVLKFPQPAVLPCLASIRVLDQQQDQWNPKLVHHRCSLNGFWDWNNAYESNMTGLQDPCKDLCIISKTYVEIFPTQWKRELRVI